MAATSEDFDRQKWAALRKYDPDIGGISEKVDLLGQRWADEFARDYLALNDKQYLRPIVERIVAAARAEKDALDVQRAEDAKIRKRRWVKQFVGASAAILIMAAITIFVYVSMYHCGKQTRGNDCKRCAAATWPHTSVSLRRWAMPDTKRNIRFSIRLAINAS
jgi:hypothetical protein